MPVEVGGSVEFHDSEELAGPSVRGALTGLAKGVGGLMMAGGAVAMGVGLMTEGDRQCTTQVIDGESQQVCEFVGEWEYTNHAFFGGAASIAGGLVLYSVGRLNEPVWLSRQRRIDRWED